jgi:chemotaxis protein MotB
MIHPSIRRPLALTALLGLIAPGCALVGKDAHDRDVAALRGQLDTLEDHKRTLRKDRDAALEKRKDALDKLSTCEREKLDVSGKLKETQGKLDTIARNSGKVGTLLSDCEKKLFKEQTDHATTKKELADARGEADKIRAQMAGIRRDLDALTQQLKKLVDAGALSLDKRYGFLVIQMSSDVLFETGKWELKKDAEPVLAELSSALSGLKGRLRIQVAGHTDDQGADWAGRWDAPGFPGNWVLSSRRALSVMRFIEGHGVPSAILSAAGFGKNLPLPSAEALPEAERRAKNRRVELLLQPDLTRMLEAVEKVSAPADVKKAVAPASE